MTINLFDKNSLSHRNLLDWEQISHSIAEFCYFESNKNNILTPHSPIDLPFIEREFQKISEYLSHINDEQIQFLKDHFNKFPSDETLDSLLYHLDKERILSMKEMNFLVLVLEFALKMKNQFKHDHVQEINKMKELNFGDFKRLFLREFRYLVDESGEVNLDKHPQLLKINKKIIDLESTIRLRILELMKSPQFSRKLQFDSYDILFDRYVIPIRSDSFQADMGSIVAKSDSGQTLYVEPLSLRMDNQQRMDLLSQKEEIINQLSIRLTRQLKPFSFLLKESFHLIKLIDFYLGKALFCDTWKLVQPIIKKDPGFRFFGLFHPLISKPVANDVDCSSHHHGVVVSGPNTGGKTVFLKSIAMSYLLFSHGFFVPAKEAELFPYESLFYFGNDLQNLSSGLSSFSGEAKNYIDLLDQLNNFNLILIDEIFNSTSSDEASALSLAYFDKLHQKSLCHLVVSTHHQMFKTMIHQDKNYLSCHVGFDKKEFRPTYKINIGTPGPSMAIEIFKILGSHHPEALDIGQKAISLLDKKNVSYETLLQEVTDKKIELDKLIRSTEILERDLKNQKGAMEGLLHLKLQDELSKAKIEIQKILDDARNVLLQAKEQQIQRPKKIDEHSFDLQVKLDSLKKNVSPPQAEKNAEAINPQRHINIHQIKVGDRVFAIHLKKEFVVKNIDSRKKTLTIAKGPLSFNVKPHEVLLPENASPQKTVQVTFEKNSTSSIDIDGRGMRLSEFQNKVESALSDLLTGEVPFLNIIHGHGDGVLKKWLRTHLQRTKDFIFEPSETGNDGETRIVLNYDSHSKSSQ